MRIGNRADGGILYWTLKLYGFAALVLLALVLFSGFLTYRYFANEAPEAPDLRTYAQVAPAVSRIYASDGTLLAEFATEWREIMPFEDMPENLVDAFIAIEDHEFFEHSGIYFKGILRAAWTNVVAGDFEQGGSTITQQVAKQFLGSEKSLTRKAKEAIVARRLEARYSKRAILSLYLNHIYLGSGAYGVKAAARRYFDKLPAELSLAESATIAGLAQAPSRYSPLANRKRAKARRDQVLDRMVEHDFIAAQEAEAAKTEPLTITPYRDPFPDREPYFAEHIRRSVIEKYGEEALMAGGLRVEATVAPVVDSLAYENVDFGARKQDKRQGWRGAEWYLEGKAREVFAKRQEALYGEEPLKPNKRYLALVEEVRSSGATVRIGATQYQLPLDNMRWASKWSATDATNDREISSAREALEEGDVVWVSLGERGAVGKFRDWFLAGGSNPRWRPEREAREPRADDLTTVQLEQVPHPQAALLTADHQTGYVLAMVGGTDFSRSEYNRAVQACRQPGSTYKPIYYALALDQGYGYDTILNDIPRAEVDPETGEIWTPTNLGDTVDNEVTLEYALVFSKNVPSVAIFKMVGAKEVEQWARKLGFTTTIIADQALALGASCTLLHELTAAFAVFAQNGKKVDFHWIRRIFDRGGTLLEDHTVHYDPQLPPADRLDRLAMTAGDRPPQAVAARTGYLMNKLLAQEVRHGFATVSRQTGIEAAGKTGTSSATMDTTYVAYTSRWITSVWLGDDLRVRPLGKSDAAYITVVPLWTRFMVEATEGHPNLEVPWEVPDGVNPRDRGDHKLGRHGPPMPLVYRSRVHRPEEGEELIDLGGDG